MATQHRLPHQKSTSKTSSDRVSQHLLIQFYSAIVERILTLSISVWNSSADLLTKKKTQEHIVTKASKVTGTDLPSAECLHFQPTSHILKRTHLFYLLPSSRCPRPPSGKTFPLKNKLSDCSINIRTVTLLLLWYTLSSMFTLHINSVIAYEEYLNFHAEITCIYLLIRLCICILNTVMPELF